MIESIESYIDEAEIGKKILESIYTDKRKKYVVVIFPDSDEKVLNTAYHNFDKFAREYDEVYIFSCVDISELSKFTSALYNVIYLSENKMNCVLRYISLLGHSRCVSLTKPYSIKADFLLDYKEITLDKIIKYFCYGIIG